MFTQGWCVISSLFLWHSWPSWLGTWLWNAFKETQTWEMSICELTRIWEQNEHRVCPVFCDEMWPVTAPKLKTPYTHIHVHTHTHARTISGIIFCCWIHFLQGLFFTLGNISLFDPYTEDRGTTTGPLPAMSPEHSCLFVMSARWINKCVLVFLLVICG